MPTSSISRSHPAQILSPNRLAPEQRHREQHPEETSPRRAQRYRSNNATARAGQNDRLTSSIEDLMPRSPMWIQSFDQLETVYVRPRIRMNTHVEKYFDFIFYITFGTPFRTSGFLFVDDNKTVPAGIRPAGAEADRRESARALMSVVANQSIEPMGIERHRRRSPRRLSERERANGASGKRCDIDAAKRRSQTENWEVRVNQSKPKRAHIRKESQHTKRRKTFPAGMESMGIERHRRSP